MVLEDIGVGSVAAAAVIADEEDIPVDVDGDAEDDDEDTLLLWDDEGGGEACDHTTVFRQCLGLGFHSFLFFTHSLQDFSDLEMERKSHELDCVGLRCSRKIGCSVKGSFSLPIFPVGITFLFS